MTLSLLLVLTGSLGLACGWWLIFMYAPVEAVMGPIQKIFYIHLPLSWWALISFFAVFAASVAFLVKRDSKWDRLAQAAAEVGVLLTTLCLVTGILWGRKSWGVWWTWDPRLSTALVMWFVYMAYLLLNGLAMSPHRRMMVRAVVGIAAFADVPLVFLSARMWRSIHPAVFASEGGGLEPEMKVTAIFCVAVTGLLWLGLVLLRRQQLADQARLDDLLYAARERETEESEPAFRK
ncbi:MAG: cytochrome c biogenesis protein CcsA [Desulfovibrionaceae bacterium]|nr:cytochrome c biogenesis protein CcsA [Desulfovibrionaceae bacterium]